MLSSKAGAVTITRSARRNIGLFSLLDRSPIGDAGIGAVLIGDMINDKFLPILADDIGEIGAHQPQNWRPRRAKLLQGAQHGATAQSSGQRAAGAPTRHRRVVRIVVDPQSIGVVLGQRLAEVGWLEPASPQAPQRLGVIETRLHVKHRVMAGKARR